MVNNKMRKKGITMAIFTTLAIIILSFVIVSLVKEPTRYSDSKYESKLYRSNKALDSYANSSGNTQKLYKDIKKLARSINYKAIRFEKPTEKDSRSFMAKQGFRAALAIRENDYNEVCKVYIDTSFFLLDHGVPLNETAQSSMQSAMDMTSNYLNNN